MTSLLLVARCEGIDHPRGDDHKRLGPAHFALTRTACATTGWFGGMLSLVVSVELSNDGDDRRPLGPDLGVVESQVQHDRVPRPNPGRHADGGSDRLVAH